METLGGKLTFSIVLFLGQTALMGIVNMVLHRELSRFNQVLQALTHPNISIDWN